MRLHLPLPQVTDQLDLRAALRDHKVYREVKALSSNVQLKSVVRYYNSWLEDLTEAEIQDEKEQLKAYEDKMILKGSKKRKLS